MLVLKGQTIDCRSLPRGRGGLLSSGGAASPRSQASAPLYYFSPPFEVVDRHLCFLALDVHVKCEYVALALSLLKVTKLVRFTKAKGHVIEHEISYRY